jgi:hypothetical protein
MRNIDSGNGTIRGLCLGTALAILMILGMNVLGHWDQTHKSGTQTESVLRVPRA